MTRADLHMHSRYSDGSQSVRELVCQAAERGLDLISITDHDTAAGQREALHWGRQYGINTVTGVEISAYDFGGHRKIHLLGYGFDPEAPRINALCRPLLLARHENTLRQISLLAKAGYPLTQEEISREFRDAPVLYKQHIMAVLIKKGLTDQIYSSLYRTLFKGEGICRGDIEYVDVFDAMEAVKADGGYAVLAHPGQQESFDLVPELAEKGLWGLELNHEDNDGTDRKRLRELAKHYGLALTGGSDAHGEYGSEHSLGDILAPADFAFPRENREPPRMQLARKVMEEAGVLLRKSRGELKESDLKNGNPADIITPYDRAVENLLVDEISSRFPGDAFFTEEEDRSTSLDGETVWIIDPIDGTTNFLHCHRDFSISCACYRRGKPWFGLVLDVMNREMYTAVAGEGARLNGTPLAGLSLDQGLDQCLVDFSLHTIHSLREQYALDLAKLTPVIRGHRAYGAASLILCRAARGETNLYISSKLCLWDYAAAGIILREQGGDYEVGPPVCPEKGERSGRLFTAWSHKRAGKEFRAFLGQAFLGQASLGQASLGHNVPATAAIAGRIAGT